jgi:hypothetical protein
MTSMTLQISSSNVQDQIAAFLYATKQIPETVDIASMVLGKVNPKTGLIDLKLTLGNAETVH